MVRSSGKFEILDRIVPKIIQFGHKILIFSQFKKLIDVMCHFFTYRGIKFLVLEGSMSHEIRDENVMRFKTDPEQQVFLISTRAGGHGINLQVADTVIIFDSDFNPMMDK
jgi:SNF2 family DNA or RNA helicase